MHRFIWLCFALAACDSREKQCGKALDAVLAEAPGKIAESVAAAPAGERDAVRAKGAKEIDSMKAKFVAVCKQAESFDVECFTDLHKRTTPECTPIYQSIVGQASTE